MGLIHTLTTIYLVVTLAVAVAVTRGDVAGR